MEAPYLHNKFLLRQRKRSIRTPRDQDHPHVEKTPDIWSNRISIKSFLKNILKYSTTYLWYDEIIPKKIYP